MRAIPSPETITPDTPLRLDIAAQVAFPAGGMTASGLRREASRGRLTVERIAGKLFTTLHHIEKMREKCRDRRRDHPCGSNPSNEQKTGGSSAGRRGSSATERASAARAALEKTAQALKGRSANTSQQSTKSPGGGIVIPLKS
jgi:hypothetical protein